jgi:hypothetical protein
MKAIHLLCHRVPGGFEKLTRISGNTYRSCCWAFGPSAPVDSLIGGWIYLHPEGKASPSEFGGVVLRVEPAKRDGKAVEDGYALIFEARKEGRGQSWRGSSHGMAWTGGIIDAVSTHEA